MFSENLKNLRRSQGISQEELAEKIGVSKSSIGMYEQGKRLPKTDTVMKKIAEYFGVSLDYLMGYEKLTPEFLERMGVSKIRMKRFRMLGDVACGKPIMCNEDYETYIDASSDIHADFCLRASGDSMINARIFDGDVVFVREQSMVENGEIAAVIVNDDEITLKRFYYYPDIKKIVLMPENPLFSPMSYEDEQLAHIRVLGKAVAFTSIIR